MSEQVKNPARRGDVIVTKGERSYVHVQSGTHRRDVYGLGIVSSVARNGDAKKYIRIEDYVFDRTKIKYNVPIYRWIVHAEQINVPAFVADINDKIKNVSFDAGEFESLESIKSYLMGFVRPKA